MSAHYLHTHFYTTSKGGTFYSQVDGELNVNLNVETTMGAETNNALKRQTGVIAVLDPFGFDMNSRNK